MADNKKRHRDCKWFDWSQRTTAGYVCTCPNITRNGSVAHLKQPSGYACKRGFEPRDGKVDRYIIEYGSEDKAVGNVKLKDLQKTLEKLFEEHRYGMFTVYLDEVIEDD